MARKNVEQIVNAWSQGKERNMKSITTDGTIIWSYRMVIAVGIGHDVFVISDKQSPSVTTTQHIRGVASLIGRHHTLDKIDEMSITRALAMDNDCPVEVVDHDSMKVAQDWLTEHQFMDPAWHELFSNYRRYGL